MGPLEIRFPFALNAQLAQTHFRIEPEVDGTFEVDGNIFRFVPEQAFHTGIIYKVYLQKGIVGFDGELLLRDHDWMFTGREPGIAYLKPANDEPELWIRFPEQGREFQVTDTDGGVFDFDVPSDGNQIVFSAENAIGGRDLWLVDRQGEEQRIIVECGNALCVQPDWSMDMSQIAFTRRISTPQGEEKYTDQIWLYHLEEGLAEPLLSDREGSNPSWSPNDRYLSFVNTNAEQLIILDYQEKTEMTFASNDYEAGSWSPDGKKLLTRVSFVEVPYPYVIVYEIDFENQLMSPILSSDQDLKEFSLPVWSPDGEWIVAGVSCPDCSPTTQLWMMRINGEQAIEITDDPRYAHGSYFWDPCGEKLVFQRFQTGSSQAVPEIWIWERGSNRYTLVAENAGLPAWVP